VIEKLVPIIWLLFIWKKKSCALLSRIERVIVVRQQQFFSYIKARTISVSMIWWWCLLCTRPRYLVRFIQTGWINSVCVDISLKSLLLPFLMHTQWRSNKYQFVVFDLIKLVFEPTIYCLIRCKSCNHDTTDAVGKN
jgi:hypothetical protein